MTFMGYDDGWKERRRLFHQYFQQGESQKYHPRSHSEARKLLHSLLINPDNFFEHLRTYVTARFKAFLLSQTLYQNDGIYYSWSHIWFPHPTRKRSVHNVGSAGVVFIGNGRKHGILPRSVMARPLRSFALIPATTVDYFPLREMRTDPRKVSRHS